MRTEMGRWLRLAACLICIAVGTSSCGGSYEETVGGVKIPIPGGMTKSQGRGMELSLPGFGGAQTVYQGKVDPDKVIEFYKREMPARGWKPSIGLLSKGGMLSYVNESATVIVMVGKTDSGTSMTIIVGGTQR
ncbi:MAG TPA: hypothetical protein VLJ79_23195 [Candidatus Binatia bacterium]|nr:hypothetical protein [Candidatus Binatia bacterium]